MNESIQNTSFYKYMWKSKNVSKYLLRLIYRLFLIIMLSAILGFGFVFIAQGVVLWSLSWAPVWKPAFLLIAKLISLEETDFTFTGLKSPWWQVVYWAIRGAIPGALFVVGGVWIFLNFGFCNQNILCMIF